MLYKVFLDTNVYDGLNYSFSNPAFVGLKNHAQKGKVQLQINSVIEGEVLSHIRDRITSAVQGMNKSFKDMALTSFRYIPGYQERIQKINAAEWIQKASDEFSELLTSCGTVHIPINGIDVEKIMQDYFQQNPPFESKKPDEFKDAIAVASIAASVQNLQGDEVYCVISNDKGFIKAVKSNAVLPGTTSGPQEHTERMKTFGDVKSFLDYLSSLEYRADYLKRFLLSGLADDDIKSRIEEAIEGIDLQIEGIDPWVEEKSVVDTDIIEFTPYILEVFDDNTASVALDVKAQVTIDYTYTDEDSSFYDKEDHQYIWQTIIENEGTYQIEFEIVVLLDISQCGNGIVSDEDEPEDFEDDSIDVIAITEQPSSMWLDEESCLSTENISTTGPMHDYEPDPDDIGRSIPERAYMTCPDCGCPIGTFNDGGNGFCTNCAPNH